ncbi:hypothetical protein L2E82_11780 [Cichorium intybus]|uniref:Uncharacterized protein n=1 Tax=Cichorium intybus TaxID=13427 RepID=A0ACB9GFA0_CICIN|nr:hypothetical protein L2E82_11780 [Cichorium intybus]
MTTRPQASRLSENIPTRQASTTALPLMSRSPRLPVSCLAGTQELYRNSTFLSTHGLKPSTTLLTPATTISPANLVLLTYNSGGDGLVEEVV